MTSSPDIASDKYSMVEIYRAETMHEHKDRVRFAHWARITSTKRRSQVRAACLGT